MNEKIKTKVNSTISTSNVEPDTRNALLGKKEIEGLDTRRSIHLHSKRKRFVDPDGISGKALIDGLVHAGVLTNDTAKEIEQVTYSQEKSKEEITIVEIWGE